MVHHLAGGALYHADLAGRAAGRLPAGAFRIPRKISAPGSHRHPFHLADFGGSGVFQRSAGAARLAESDPDAVFGLARRRSNSSTPSAPSWRPTSSTTRPLFYAWSVISGRTWIPAWGRRRKCWALTAGVHFITSLCHCFYQPSAAATAGLYLRLHLLRRDPGARRAALCHPGSRNLLPDHQPVQSTAGRYTLDPATGCYAGADFAYTRLAAAVAAALATPAPPHPAPPAYLAKPPAGGGLDRGLAGPATAPLAALASRSFMRIEPPQNAAARWLPNSH